MKLEFPGTRGEIEEKSIKHKYHSSLIIREKNANILIDLGEKYSPYLEKEINNLDGILITHAHPDHYIWTIKEKDNIEIPVYLTDITLNYGRYRPKVFNIIEPDNKFLIKELTIKAYKVIHSLRCPAIGYKIANGKNIVYAPDIVDFKKDKENVFKNVDILVADGSSLNINMVRRRDGKLFGHAMVKTIIGWCKKYNIKELIITHCGKQIVLMDEKELVNKIYEYSENKVNVTVAYDGFIKEI